ncbi:MAG: hypothetical protein KY443_04725 [Actinobacteria bacterium]|nr:hypothetical protein [Actinomycetota bacterium]
MSRRASDSVRPRTLWAAIVLAPIVGSTYFMVVYLVAEAACAPAVGGLSEAFLRAVAYGATAASIVALLGGAAYAWVLRRKRQGADAQAMPPFLGAVGLMLAGLFLFLVLLVAAPVVGSTLC